MQEQSYKNCQSCGMPLSKDANGGGTEKDGSKSTMYCGFCYADGAFVGGEVSIEEFSKMSQKGMKEGGMNSFFAWLFSRTWTIGHLKRWKN